MKAYLKEISRFLLLLLAIQFIRGLIVTGLSNVFHPASDLVRWAYVDMIAFSLVGMGLISFCHPRRMQLALKWETVSLWARIAYISAGILVLLLLGTTYLLGQDIFITNLDSVLVIPVFEELLFRGWGWTRLEQVASFKNAQIINWLVISLLFGLWHFGYLDYVLKVALLATDAMGKFLPDEIHHYIHHRADRGHPALAYRTRLRLDHSSCAYQSFWKIRLQAISKTICHSEGAFIATDTA